METVAGDVISVPDVLRHLTVSLLTTAGIYQFLDHAEPRVHSVVCALNKETRILTSIRLFAQLAQPQQEKYLIVRLR